MNDISYNDIFNHSLSTPLYPKNQIFLLDNFISTNDCNTFIDIIDKYAVDKEEWGDSYNVFCNYLQLENFKEKELKKQIDDKIFKYINNFVNILQDEYKINCSGDSGYCLRKIYGPTRFHKDGININPIDDKYIPIRKIRNMSIIIALNDDYNNGTFHFPNQNFKVKLKKGQLIAFPPYWTHIHGVEPPTDNTFRYTINTWLYE